MSLSLIEAVASMATMGLILTCLTPLVVQGLDHAQRFEQQSRVAANSSRGLEILQSRVREACYIWPPGSTLELGSSPSTRNTTGPRATSIWKQGDLFLALLLPPAIPGQDPQFLAYYPMLRSHYLRHFSGSNALQPQPSSDNQTWVLLEYRRNLTPGPAPDCAQLAATIQSGSLSGGSARLFLDQLDPLTPWIGLQTEEVRLAHAPEVSLDLVTAVFFHPGHLSVRNGQIRRSVLYTHPVQILSTQQWWGGAAGQFRPLLPPW